jgi:hypothetical protein
MHGSEGRRSQQCDLLTRQHFDTAVLDRHLDADAAVLPVILRFQVGIAFGIEIFGMGIKGGQHAVERCFDQLVAVGVFDEAAAHLLECLSEQSQRFRLASIDLTGPRCGGSQRQQGGEDDCDPGSDPGHRPHSLSEIWDKASMPGLRLKFGLAAHLGFDRQYVAHNPGVASSTTCPSGSLK